jgi:D-sedoheptulose 7-phosphate isomerase
LNPSKAAVSSDTLSRIQADAARYLAEAVDVLRATADTEAERVAVVSAMLAERLRRGGTLYTCGNGGSAADAQHVATELAGKFFLHRPGLAAIALTTNTSALTAIANDFSYDEVFVRQLSGLGRPGDVLMAFTTSGRSANTRLATEWARAHEVITVGFTGRPGKAWADTLDHAFVVASDVTPHIQQAHITLGHAICALAEAELFGPHGTPPQGAGRS